MVSSWRKVYAVMPFFGGPFMSLQIFGHIVRFFGDAGGLFCDITVLIFLLLPLAAFAVYFPLLLLCGGVRGKSRVWFLVLGDVCLFLLLALYLCRGDLQDAAPVLAVFLCAKILSLLLYGAVCLVPRTKKEKKKRSRPDPAEEFDLGQEPTFAAECSALPEKAAPRPQKVRCYEDGGRVYVDKDVRLEHIFSVLERLKGMALGAGDRLEVQKMEELLRVYRAKAELSAPEADALNDILASLLKMMAKYDL